MLNNTEYKSELHDLHESVDNQVLMSLGLTGVAAANAPHFDHEESAERRMRRERRCSRNTVSVAGGWHVSLW